MVLKCLVEGMSIRGTERLTDVSREAVLSLLVRAGEGCAKLLDVMMRGLPCERLELDEIWAFVQKKQRRVTDDDNRDEVGDTWTYVAFCPDTKLVATYLVGKRNGVNTCAFIDDIARRLKNRIQISTDGLEMYKGATAGVERQNLTMRMQIRRMTRLTNAHSKSMRHHKAATALHYGFYNLARVNEAVRCTPAMAAGITKKVWSMGELLDAALTGEIK